MINEKEAEYYIEGMLVKVKLDSGFELAPFDKNLLQIINHKFPRLVRTLLNGGTKLQTQPPSKRKGLDYYDNRKENKNFYPNLHVDEIDVTIDK